LVFLGFYLKKMEIEDEFPEVVSNLRLHGIQLLVSSSSCTYLALSAATRAGILDADKPILVGRTSLVNQVETLIWEKIESKKEDFENSVLEPAEELNVGDENFFRNTECQLALTGRAFELLSQ